MAVNTIDTFDYSIISRTECQKRRKGNQGTKRNLKRYKDLFCAFDIETTNDLKLGHAYMYIWQFQIEDQTIIGRTWDEYLIFCNRVLNQLKEHEYLMVYVHNLSFEFSFICGIYNFQKEEVFSIDRRKVLKCSMYNHIEYRCSYLLTNMSLDAFTSKMGVTHKLSGDEFNYKKIRYPWSRLNDYEMQYCITDVISLVEALKVYFSIENDNFYTIPYTSTGFVRRDVKRAMRHFNRGEIEDMQPNFEIFEILREAFRGGNTHCNRYYADMILDNISSYDRVSSYPDVQINELFPMSKWFREDNPSLERVCRVMFKHKRACLMRAGFSNIRLKDPLWGCPYIPKHKCRKLSRHDNDNGRILDADYLEISLTDIDLKIILEEYDFGEITIFDFYHARYGRLPKPLRDEILKYFKAKTELKNVTGQELFYFLQKQKLNSIYGLTCQSPIKQSIDYINGEFIVRNDDESELLKEHNEHAFLAYSWGVWTTCHARMELEKAIRNTGNNFVYCDTDSVKFIDDGSISFDSYNKSRKNDSIRNGGTATDIKGKTYYLGLYEYEGTYKSFVSMGAKKYCYLDNGDNLHITVAGVAKSKGARELSERGGIVKFKEGFTFHKAGGTEAIYNYVEQPFNVKVGKHNLTVTSNVLIRDSTYTLGVNGEYRNILNNPAIWLDLIK